MIDQYSNYHLLQVKEIILLCKSKQKQLLYNHFFVIVLSSLTIILADLKKCKKKILKKNFLIHTLKQKNHPEFEYRINTLTFLTLHCNIFFHKKLFADKKLPRFSALPANLLYPPIFLILFKKIMKKFYYYYLQ